MGRNRPFSPFFCLFRRFPEGAKSTRKIQKTEEKGLLPQISSDLLKPPSLKPPFAALQLEIREMEFHLSDKAPPATLLAWPPHAEPRGEKKTFFLVRIFEARKGIPKNLSSQVLGEVRVNFLG